MESERPIEKLLRAFAKKRREQARAPFELSPDARRRLLREVQRQHDTPSDERGFFRALIPMPRLAYVLGVASIIAILAAMLLPALSKAKSKAQRATALSQRRQAELELQMAREELPAPATAPVASAMPAPTAADERFGDIPVTNSSPAFVFHHSSTASKSLDGLDQEHMAFDSGAQTDTTLALNVSSNMTLYSFGATPRAAGDAASTQNSWGFGPSRSVAGVNGYTASVEMGGRFRLLSDRLMGSTQAMSPVLASFEVRVSGTNVRVVDGDGSVYNGNLKSQPELSLSAGQATLTVLADKPLTGNLGGEFSFQVEGTNRTLNQPIVFAGKLRAPTNAPVSSAPMTSQTEHPPSAAAEPWPGKLDISGVLTIDGKQTEIQAAPVAP